jgi:hypothetical protein
MNTPDSFARVLISEILAVTEHNIRTELAIVICARNQTCTLCGRASTNQPTLARFRTVRHSTAANATEFN